MKLRKRVVWRRQILDESRQLKLADDERIFLQATSALAGRNHSLLTSLPHVIKRATHHDGPSTWVPFRAHLAHTCFNHTFP